MFLYFAKGPKMTFCRFEMVFQGTKTRSRAGKTLRTVHFITLHHAISNKNKKGFISSITKHNKNVKRTKRKRYSFVSASSAVES
jgi:hypothetical protein